MQEVFSVNSLKSEREKDSKPLEKQGKFQCGVGRKGCVKNESDFSLITSSLNN